MNILLRRPADTNDEPHAVEGASPSRSERRTWTFGSTQIGCCIIGAFPSPTKPRLAGVWSLSSLPEAGKPAAGWGGVGGPQGGREQTDYAAPADVRFNKLSSRELSAREFIVWPLGPGSRASARSAGTRPSANAIFDDAESIQDSRNFARKIRQSDPRKSAFGRIGSVVRFVTGLDYDRRFVETHAVAVEDQRHQAGAERNGKAAANRQQQPYPGRNAGNDPDP